jgi:hypothetical protein
MNLAFGQKACNKAELGFVYELLQILLVVTCITYLLSYEVSQADSLPGRVDVYVFGIDLDVFLAFVALEFCFTCCDLIHILEQAALA